MKTYTQLINELTLGTKYRAFQARMMRNQANPSQAGIEQAARNLYYAKRHEKKLVDAGDITKSTASDIATKHMDLGGRIELKKQKKQPYRYQQLKKSTKSKEVNDPHGDMANRFVSAVAKIQKDKGDVGIGTK
jgi:hypothetical protein